MDSLTILLTGFVVVFAVLLILIGIIKLYGTIIYNLQNKKRKNVVKEKVVVEPEPAPVDAPIPVPVSTAAAEQDDDALIAVIAAAVYSVYSPDQVRIRSVRRVSTGASAWRAAGLRDNTRVFWEG